MEQEERRKRYSSGWNLCADMKETYRSIDFDTVKEQIAEGCSFELGARLIKDTRPQFHTLWIQRELQRCREAIAVYRVQLSFPNDDLLDITPWLTRSQKNSTLRPNELKGISTFLLTCERVKRFLADTPSAYLELHDLQNALQKHDRLRKHIDACISSEGDVYDHASEKLAALRREQLAVAGSIAQEARRFVASHASILMDTITAIRNERTCVLVKVSEKNSVRGIIHGESASGQAVYVEPASLVTLNNRLQSIKGEEEQEVERILRKLSEEVKEEANTLFADLDTMSILDALFAKAKWCVKRDGCVAELDEKSHHLWMKEARHPLIDDQKVVANTYEMKEDIHCLLISGSNTGGKTVTLKTIALFLTMTHAGFPILCEEARIPFFHAIYLDVGDQQSIQESLSTFSSHLSRLSIIAEQADAHSFVVLDELGSGTDPNEGECLAIAILEALLKQNAVVIASTHFAKVKAFANTRDDILLSSVAFDMDTMMPTYQYMEGVSGQSNAFAIASRYHLRKEIVDRAKELKQQGQSDAQTLMERLEENAAEMELEKQALHARLDEIQQLRSNLQKEKENFHRQQEKALEKAMEEAHARYEEQLAQAQAIIDDLRKMNADHKPHEVAQKLHDLRQLQPLVDEEAPVKPQETIEKGDYVQISSLNYHGEVLSVNKNKASVLANGMKMNVSINDLCKIDRPKCERSEKSYKKSVRASFSLECNVIGMHVDEALAVVDKYLDNAILNRASSVRIIHGMGTGALRKAIHNYLKKHVKVESFRMGGQGEGGLGATVVELKQKGKR